MTQNSYVDGVFQHKKTVNGANGTTNYARYYFLKDHLGSVDVITSEAGYVYGETSFNAWGERRDVSTWQASNVNTSWLPTSRGYTGHEMLDDSGLIHMNGRVYDPTVGRFLSADILIQAPNNTQSYNRYSYVMNNPLSYIDPTGYSCEGLTGSELQTCIDAEAEANAEQARREAEQIVIEFRALIEILNNKQCKVLCRAQVKRLLTDAGFIKGENPDNPAIEVYLDSIKDGRLSRSEANRIWRANNDANLEVSVNANLLSAKLKGSFIDGQAKAKVITDWSVHGSNNVRRHSDGTFSLEDGDYDFLPHPRGWYSDGVLGWARWKGRNVETYIGFWDASIGGRSVGKDFLIIYVGSPKIVNVN